MILAVDVDYGDQNAQVAGVTFEQWQDESAAGVFHSRITSIAEYEPGQFYKRELPCVLQLLKEHVLQPSCLVVDGFVVLGQELKPGLGMHLYKALDGKVPVIGVAKSAFHGSKVESELLRGASRKPLFITSVGIDLEKAKAHIASMHGDYRIPTLLKLVDSQCRRVL